MDNKKKGKGQFIRFLIVGTVATAVLYAVYYGLNYVLNHNIAYTIGFVVSFMVNYLMTTIYTFKSKLSFKKFVGFGVQQISNYVLQIGFLNFFLWLGMSEKLAPLPVFVIILPINFLLLRFVYKTKNV